MLKIKLARFGKRNQPHYRVVVTEGKSKRDGQYKVQLGRYAPTASPKILEIDTAEFEAWVKKGAQPTETVQGLFDRIKSGNPFPVKKARPSKKAVAKAKAEKAAKEQLKEEPKAEVIPEVSAEPTTSEAEAPAEAPTETEAPKETSETETAAPETETKEASTK